MTFQTFFSFTSKANEKGLDFKFLSFEALMLALLHLVFYISAFIFFFYYAFVHIKQ